MPSSSGLGYAVGSLSCTLPIFLVVVGGALGAAAGFLASFSQFLAFALGMGVVVIADHDWRSHLSGRRGPLSCAAYLPHVHRASSLFLVGAGGYLIYYWVFFAGLNL